jgi:hypothetical protein
MEPFMPTRRAGLLGGRAAHQFRRRWIASADTPDRPSLGLGYLPTEALEESLAAYEGAVDDLMRDAPEIRYWR